MSLWRRFAGEVTGRSNRNMLRLLRAQIDAAVMGANVAREAALGDQGLDDAYRWIATIEHAGDDAREELIAEFSGSLVTPLDREDLFRLSRSIDDVLDDLRDFVREIHLFDATYEQAVQVADPIIDGLLALREAVDALEPQNDGMPERLIRAKRSCNAIRRAYEQQLAELLTGAVDVEMLRRRELLRRLDVVGLRVGEAVDALADASVKRAL